MSSEAIAGGGVQPTRDAPPNQGSNPSETNDVVVSVRGVGKCYLLWDRPSDRLRHPLRARLARWLPIAEKQYHKEFWALRDIAFDLRRGQALGIVGRNGCGKSTLLQIIVGTLAPTTGEIRVNGRVSALLELGSGFNPMFTGRENVYMNAAILGLSPEQIDKRYESIVTFADIGDFINQPVKNYSSGMMVRLAFSVAVSVDPEILVVDEALAVGDELFQRKCFGRIREMREKGVTILFVSHAAGLVTQLCDEGLLLDRGELLLQDKPKTVVTLYHKLLFAPTEKREAIREEIRNGTASGTAEEQRTSAGRTKPAHTPRRETGKETYAANLVPKTMVEYPPQGARITNIRITTLSGRRVNILSPGGEYYYTYDVEFHKDAFRVRFGSMFKTVSGLELGGIVSHPEDSPLESVAQGSRFSARFRFRCALAAGMYFCNAGVTELTSDGEIFLHRIVDATCFRVMPEPGAGFTSWVDLRSAEWFTLLDGDTEKVSQ